MFNKVYWLRVVFYSHLEPFVLDKNKIFQIYMAPNIYAFPLPIISLTITISLSGIALASISSSATTYTYSIATNTLRCSCKTMYPSSSTSVESSSVWTCWHWCQLYVSTIIVITFNFNEIIKKSRSISTTITSNWTFFSSSFNLLLFINISSINVIIIKCYIIIYNPLHRLNFNI